MTEKPQFRVTKVYDVLAATPMVVIYALAVFVNLIPDVRAKISELPSPAAWLDIARDASNITYFAVIIALVFLRRTPVARSAGILPRAVALASVTMVVIRPKFLPFAHLPMTLEAIAVALTVFGTVVSVVVLVSLGRSFSILPEARRLVATGPYRIVRHPLYVVEEIGNFGVMLQYLQPWSLLLEIVNISLQLWRISYEERVLTQTFPEYATYAARTRRLIPGLY